MRPETIQLLGLISLRTLAEYDPSALRRTTDLSRRELDERIDRLLRTLAVQEESEVHEVRSRLNELRAIEAEAETQIEQNFLLRNLGRSSLEYAFRMALTYSRTADVLPSDSRTASERVVAAQEVPSPSRETEFVRLGVMRLLRELPEYEAAFEYPVRGKTIDCFLKPHASDHPVIFVEAKITLRSLRRAREAVAQLRRAAAGWGRKAVTVLLAGSVEEAVQYNWPQMFSGSHLLWYDIERNDFVGEGVQEIVSAVRVAEEG